MSNEFQVDSWDEYIGQTLLKERLAIHIASANERDAAMEHVLLVGPPGSGKTSISRIIAEELFVDFADYMMPVKPQVLKRLCHTHYGVVLFDEIHRCSSKQQEELLTLVQGNYYQTDSGQIIDCPNLTIIGATTEPDKIIAPLYDRFAIKPMFEEYTDVEMSQIASGMAVKSGVELTPEQLTTIGSAAGGVPRNAKQMIVMARDLKIAKGDVDILEVLSRCNVTAAGLTDNHLEYLGILAKNSPSGVDVICAQMRLPKSVIMDLERLLVRRELIHYTKGGREILSNGYKALKYQKVN